MCGGINREGIVSEIVISVVKNEKFFENMTTEEKIKSVANLYRTLYHEIVEHNHEMDHPHPNHHEHQHNNGFEHRHEYAHEHEHFHGNND